MVLEKEILPFFEWLPWASLTWVIAVAALLLIGGGLALLFSIIRRGPAKGIVAVFRVMFEAVTDVVSISPRRVSALAWLAVKESIRKKVVVGFAIFILVLMMAGWFLDPASTDPGRLYLSFVMTATSYLVLLLALFLSVFSLPSDMKSKTLHTVVTKPVRHSEIVLGRIIGFTIVCTALLVLMGGISYFFVVQGLAHEHTLTAGDLAPRGGESGETAPLIGDTSKENGHRHEAYVDPTGPTRVRQEQGHTHSITVTGSGPDATYEVGPPEGVLVARVPIRGKLRFRGQDGRDKAEGINVGDEWTYRSYIQGGTDAAAIWTFDNIREADFPEDRVPIEMTLGVFRTHKGEITRAVLGSLAVRNPDTGLTVEIEIFESKEFITQKLWIPKQIRERRNRRMVSQRTSTPEGVVSIPPESELDPRLAMKNEYDLFTDLVTPDGRVEIWIQCIEPGQHFGAAQADLYFRASDAPVALNFIKGFYGIWLQVLIVVSFGVMFSTFLNGAVAMLATIGILVAGFFTERLNDLGRGDVIGGGPVEAFRRLVTQENVMTDLDPGFATDVIKLVDRLSQPFLYILSKILPSFGDFSSAAFVASGFNIPGDFMLSRTVTALAFVIPLFIIGYLFLRNREVAR